MLYSIVVERLEIGVLSHKVTTGLPGCPFLGQRFGLVDISNLQLTFRPLLAPFQIGWPQKIRLAFWLSTLKKFPLKEHIYYFQVAPVKHTSLGAMCPISKCSYTNLNC